MLAISIFAGLPLALWVYKCLMLVLFQRKIIYMGYAPIGARDESLSSVSLRSLSGVVCEEITIPNGPKTSLSGIIVRSEAEISRAVDAVIVYFQGNAGNPLHRVPVFQSLLSSQARRNSNLVLDIVAVAPRSYWKSTPRRPTQPGILSDYHCVLQYTLNRYPSTPIILYGHSLGGSISTCLTSTLTDTRAQSQALDNANDPRYSQIKGLILENPFTSIPDMVRALYPERWVPYQYLAPLAFDNWDALMAMRIASPHTVLGRLKQNTLTIVSEKDEVVPPEMSHRLADSVGPVPKSSGLARTVIIRGALHENAWQKHQWSVEMVQYIKDILGQKV